MGVSLDCFGSFCLGRNVGCEARMEVQVVFEAIVSVSLALCQFSTLNESVTKKKKYGGGTVNKKYR